MKKNKGFTLIELLTVIAILAIILLIAAPTILGVLDKARKNTFKNQALLYVSGLKTQMALSATGDSDIESKLNWTTEGNKRVTTISISELNNLIMDAEGLTSGSIKIEEDLTTNKYTYILMDVANLDYKIPGSVLSTELDVEDIYKADEKVEEKIVIDLSKVPSTVRHGESYELPTSYAGNSIECKVGNTIITNTSELDAGTYTVSCTSGSVTESKEITVQYEVDFMYSSISNFINTLPTIDRNNITVSLNRNITTKIYLDKAGYTFDWIWNSGSGSLSFTSDNGTTTTFVNGTQIATTSGNYTNTESGHIVMTSNISSVSINNLKYNDQEVIIKSSEYIGNSTPRLIFGNSCVLSAGKFSCGNKITENNSIVSGEVYVYMNWTAAGYLEYTEIKINDGNWELFTNTYSQYKYKKLTEPGTYRIKARYNYSDASLPHYSKESEEFVVTIE